MVYIQSIIGDASTNDALDWLFYLSKKRVMRFNDDDFIRKVSIRINGEGAASFQTDRNGIQIKEIDRFWYRRGTTRINPWQGVEDLPSGKIALYLENELSPVVEHLDNLSGLAKVNINRYRDNKTNKISNLLLAGAAGLMVPETLITNDPIELNDFAERFGRVITKPFAQNNFSFRVSGYNVLVSSTTAIAAPLAEPMVNQKMLPSLYQQYIEKKYELRIFYLNGVFYPMAIFSQADEQTKIDFRNYNGRYPNRTAPYRLPVSIEKKLHHFMVSADLNCGSIDMIFTPDGDYVFLEVNPVGQYQWLERACNYPISKRIAEFLAY